MSAGAKENTSTRAELHPPNPARVLRPAKRGKAKREKQGRSSEEARENMIIDELAGKIVI